MRSPRSPRSSCSSRSGRSRGPAIAPPTPASTSRSPPIGDSYGVLDLPVRPLPEISSQDYSARYQAYQLVHRKGIAAVTCRESTRAIRFHRVSSRTIARRAMWSERVPVALRARGHSPALHRRLSVRRLASAFAGTPENLPGSWAADDAQAFVSAGFGETPPIADDDLVRVWAIPAVREALPAQPVIELGKEWYPPEPAWRWTSSPARPTITAPRAQQVELAMSVPLLHDRRTGRGLGEESVPIFTAGGQSISRSVRAGDVVRVALSLVPGAQNVSVALARATFVHRTMENPTHAC